MATFDASAHSLGSRTVPIFVQSSQVIDRNPSQSNCRMLKLDYSSMRISSRKLLRIKVTPDLHLTYSKNGGNLGLVLKMKNIACISILLTKHVKCTYLYLFKFVLYSILHLKRINKLNGHKIVYNDNLRKLPNEYGDVSVMCNFPMEIPARTIEKYT